MAYYNSVAGAVNLNKAPKQITAADHIVGNVLNLPGDASSFDVLVGANATVYTVNWNGNPVGAVLTLTIRAASGNTLTLDGSGSPSNLANAVTPISANAKDTVSLRYRADGKWYPMAYAAN